MADYTTVLIEGDGLILAPVEVRWVDEILKANVGNVRDFFIPLDDEQAVLEWIQKCRVLMSEGSKLELAILAGEGRAFVGMIAINDAASKPEVGLWISPEVQGRGYGKRALQILLDWMFASTPIKAIDYVAESSNQASIRLARSLGCEDMGVFNENGKRYSKFVCRPRQD